MSSLFLCAGQDPQLFDERGHYDEGNESLANIPVSEMDAALAVFEEAERRLMAGQPSLLPS